jgi:hypothetical protein
MKEGFVEDGCGRRMTHDLGRSENPHANLSAYRGSLKMCC